MIAVTCRRKLEDHVIAENGRQGSVHQPGALAGSDHKQTHCPASLFTLDPSNYRMSEMENGLFSELDLLKRPPWSILPQETMLESVVYIVAGDHVSVCGLCCHCGLY